MVDNQRRRVESIRQETDEYEKRAKYLHSKINEVQENLFKDQMGEKIKELVKENLKLSIDAQCLSIQLDIYNQGVENQGMVDNSLSPVQQSLSPNMGMNHPMGGSPVSHMGGSPVSPMVNHRVNTPTSNPNVDPNSYQYAQLMHPQGTMPYPVQPHVFYQPINGRQLAPHHEAPRQVSPVHTGPQMYTYDPHTGQSINLLRQVPPAAQNWGQQMPSYHMTPMQMPPSPGQMQHVPPVPPRPSDLNIRQRGGRSGVHTPNRPPPPPPTPPKPFSSSPNLERSRSSNEVQDNHGERSNERQWQCAKCTFDNHEDIIECEICQTPRHGSVGNVYTTLSPQYTEAKDQRPHSSKRHHKSKKRSDRSPQ